MDNKLVYLELRKNKSKEYENALHLLRGLPHNEYDGTRGVTIAWIDDVDEYIENQYEIIRFIEMSYHWKTASIYYKGKRHTLFQDFNIFAEELAKEAGAYGKMICNHLDYSMKGIHISNSGDITYEKNLPLHFAHYPGGGAYFAFSEQIDTTPYFCQCQKKVIERESDWRLFPTTVMKIYNVGKNSKPSDVIKFKKMLCFKCNKAVPTLYYGNPMYMSSFETRYGWYMRAKNREIQFFGNDETYEDQKVVEYSRQIASIKKRLIDLDYKGGVKVVGMKKSNMNPRLREAVELTKDYENAIENATRESLGFKKIGDAWVSETILFHIVEGIFPDKTVKRHFRPDWLEKLELDVFVPEEKLAFEYQGIQHYQPIEHWGGIEKFKIQQEHDERKKRVCKEYGIRLIYVKYNEVLSTEFVKKLINSSSS